MKKLLILTAVLMMLVGLVGCRCCDWCFRGAPWGSAVPVTTYTDVCPPVAACDPCAEAPVITPGPAPYSAVPGP